MLAAVAVLAQKRRRSDDEPDASSDSSRAVGHGGGARHRRGGNRQRTTSRRTIVTAEVVPVEVGEIVDDILDERVRREAVALERSFRAETDPTASDALTCLTPDDADKTPSERRLKRVHSAMSMASQLSPW